MNDQDRGILVGMVLGDGYLNVRYRLRKNKTKEDYKYESSELVIVHSIKQRDYVNHKIELVRKIFGGVFSVTEKRATLSNGNTHLSCGFSKSNTYFKILQRMMYVDKKKTITYQVLNMLTPHGIAIWYMDDGHARVNLNKDGFVSSVATEFATCCSEKEAKIICDWFLEQHNIIFKPYHMRDQFCIRCNTKESHNFARLVDPYIIPSMRYKLKHVADLNLHERQAVINVCEKCGNDIYAQRCGNLCDKCYSKDRYWNVVRIRDNRKYHGPYKTRLITDDIVRTSGNRNR